MEGNSQQIADIANKEVNLISIENIFCNFCLYKQKNLELRCERGYWKKQHQRAVEREEQLKQENEQLKARIRYLQKMPRRPEPRQRCVPRSAGYRHSGRNISPNGYTAGL